MNKKTWDIRRFYEHETINIELVESILRIRNVSPIPSSVIGICARFLDRRFVAYEEIFKVGQCSSEVLWRRYPETRVGEDNSIKNGKSKHTEERLCP